MKVKIKDIELVPKTVEKEIEFPYYGWWSDRKNEIIKIEVEYYNYIEVLDKKVPCNLKCIIIEDGFGMNPSIVSKKISISNDEIDGELLTILKDYSTPATKEEYENFRKRVIEKLT